MPDRHRSLCINILLTLGERLVFAGVVLTQTSLSLGYVMMGMLAVRRPTNQHTPQHKK